MKSVPAVFRAWLAVSLLVMLLMSCSSSTPPGGGGGGGTPTVYAGLTDCYLCHADGSINRFDGMQIVSRWLDGPHSNNESMPPVGHPDNIGVPDFEELDNEPGCSLDCHDQLGDGESLEDFEIATGIDYLGRVNRPVVGCESCHGEGADHAGTVGLASPEYPTPDRDRCGQCHDVYFDVGPLIIHNGLYDLVNLVITDTHYDDPATSDIIEGYTISLSKEQACLDCHDVHSVNMTINRQWAESAHAGHILEAKEASPPTTGAGDLDEVNAVKAAGVHEGDPADPGYSPAWVQFNWDSMATPPPPPFPDKKPCQRCHTATGAKNYFDDSAGYDPANNDYSHLDGWLADPTNGSGQNEMLYCWGCHDSVRSGSVREPGPITAEYLFEDDTDEFPDVTSSNICVACHAGRESGKDVKAVTDGEIVSQDFISSHYLAAAGVLFKAIGFEYEGTYRFYDNLVFFAHDEIGTVVADAEVRPGTGTSGPCAACHLGNGNVSPDHTMELGGFERGTCGTNGACHNAPPFLMTEAVLDEESEAFENALYALSAILKNRGFTWTADHPYFADDTDWTDWINPVVTATPEAGRQMLGAAFNLNMLLHEPGGFAHNRYYAKRLLIDSLDFAYNGVLETLSENANASDHYDGSDAGTAIQAAVGMTYNDHDGVLQTFLQAQADSAEDYLDSSSSEAGFQRR